MANLLNATHIATVFLDAGLRIKLFTPAATRMFNLIATDIGRPIGDIVTRFSDDDLLREAQEVLRDLTPREKEVTHRGRPLVRSADHALPHAGQPHRRRRDHLRGHHRAQRGRGRGRSGALPPWSRIPWTRSSARTSTGPSEPGTEAPSGFMGTATTRPWADRSGCSSRKTARRMDQGHGHAAPRRARRATRDGASPQGRTTYRSVALTVSPIRDSDGKVVSASVTGRDITERSGQSKSCGRARSSFVRWPSRRATEKPVSRRS